MQTLNRKLSDLNIREVSQIQELILERYPNVDLIFLHGELVEGTPKNVAGGYDLLVLVEGKNTIDFNVLLTLIEKKCPREGRVMKNVTIQVLSTSFFKKNFLKSNFLFSIFHKGMVIYDKNPKLWENLSIHKKVRDKHLTRVRESIACCLDFGEKFMNVAGLTEHGQHWRINTLFLYYALEQILMALEYKYFGFIRHFDAIGNRFRVAKYTNEELFNYSELKKSELYKMCRNLEKYKNCHFMDNSSYTLAEMRLYTDLIMEIEEIVVKACRERIPQDS